MNRLRWLREQWVGTWNYIRYPYRLRSAWINVGLWVLALAFAGIALTAQVITRNFTWTWFVALFAIGEMILLHRAIEGLFWRLGVEKLRARSRTSPGRGSTGE